MTRRVGRTLFAMALEDVKPLAFTAEIRFGRSHMDVMASAGVTSCRSRVDADYSTDTSTTALVPIAEVLELLRDWPDEYVTVERVEHGVRIGAPRANFRFESPRAPTLPVFGKSSRALMLHLPVSTVNDLYGAIDFVLWRGREDTQFVLWENGRMAATDGVVYAEAVFAVKSGVEFRFLLGGVALGLLTRQDGWVDISIADDSLVFETSRVVIQTRLLDQDWPGLSRDAQGLTAAGRLSFDPFQLRAALRSFAHLSDLLVFDLGGKSSRLYVENGRNESEVGLDCCYEGPRIELALSLSDLQEVLTRATSKHAFLEVCSDEHPVKVITSSGFRRYLLMPFRRGWISEGYLTRSGKRLFRGPFCGESIAELHLQRKDGVNWECWMLAQEDGVWGRQW